MNRETLEIIFDWLEKNTKNFIYDTNYRNLVIENVLYTIKLQESNVVGGFIPKEQLPMAIWFNIFENHLLVNGNKRLAFVLYNFYSQKKNVMNMSKEDIDKWLNDNYKDELKYLEDK